jgi:hypothetical protein
MDDLSPIRTAARVREENDLARLRREEMAACEHRPCLALRVGHGVPPSSPDTVRDGVTSADCPPWSTPPRTAREGRPATRGPAGVQPRPQQVVAGAWGRLGSDASVARQSECVTVCKEEDGTSLISPRYRQLAFRYGGVRRASDPLCGRCPPGGSLGDGIISP